MDPNIKSIPPPARLLIKLMMTGAADAVRLANVHRYTRTRTRAHARAHTHAQTLLSIGRSW